MELYANRNTGFTNNLGITTFIIPHFNPVLVHIKYASNMAACYGTDVNDVTSLHVCTVGVSDTSGP